MSGNALLLILVAWLALYLGTKLERARRAGQDLQAVTRRLAQLRATRRGEYLSTTLIVGGSAAVLFMIARWG